MTIVSSGPSLASWLIKAKIYVEPPWEGGPNVYGPGHVTRLAAMPIYGIKL